MLMSLEPLCFCVFAGGVNRAPCPFECLSPKYSPPHCTTPIEGFIEDLGGPWVFTAGSLLVTVLLAWTISVARMRLIGTEEVEFTTPKAAQEHRVGATDQSLPFLESLNEVRLSGRVPAVVWLV